MLFDRTGPNEHLTTATATAAAAVAAIGTAIPAALGIYVINVDLHDASAYVLG